MTTDTTSSADETTLPGARRDAICFGDIADGGGLPARHRQRRLTGSFGTVGIGVPARIGGVHGLGCSEWKSKVLPRYARMTRQVEALIAGTYAALHQRIGSQLQVDRFGPFQRDC